MNDVNELHQKAMEKAELAHIYQFNGDLVNSKTLYAEAHILEKKAASKLFDKFDFEPTRSVLYRSAATLALRCGELEDSERLIASALLGNPPIEIREELRDLLEEVYFYRHLELKGVKLRDDEFQLSLAGTEVGYGFIKSEHYINRVNTASKIIYRTIERKLGIKFSDDGSINKKVKDGFPTYLSIPRAASFAVTIRMGEPTEQIEMYREKEEIINEVFNCVELVEKGDLVKLSNHIKDDAYFTNFVSLVKQLSPDGKHINFVGLSSNISDKFRTIQLTKTKEDLSLVKFDKVKKEEKQENVIIIGKLQYADGRIKQKKQIGIKDKKNKTHRIQVPVGLMDDIVKPLWDEEVKVFGKEIEKNLIELIEIEKYEP